MKVATSFDLLPPTPEQLVPFHGLLVVLPAPASGVVETRKKLHSALGPVEIFGERRNRLNGLLLNYRFLHQRHLHCHGSTALIPGHGTYHRACAFCPFLLPFAPLLKGDCLGRSAHNPIPNRLRPVILNPV